MLAPRTPFIVSLIAGVIGVIATKLTGAALKAIYDVTIQDFWKDTLAPYLTKQVGPWSTIMLEWIGPFWAGAISAFGLMFVVEMIFAWRRSKAPVEALPIPKVLNLTRASYEGETINVAANLEELSRLRNYGLLEGKIFTNCRFEGPASIFLTGHVSIAGDNKFDYVGSALKVPAGEMIVGALPLPSCTLHSCIYDKIQFIVTEGEMFDTFVRLADPALPARKINIYDASPDVSRASQSQSKPEVRKPQ
ncbi:hypothetical protein FV218_15810 [Methylobacterium sp. WL69]|uniref:hypothetical protein n=1 Tax=Methylobacterium sp. WL69 TaxID=2603893 RepID=UPI0011CAF1DA|nr:hypothetical protein [Methylobacterium sp. WL69]TXM70946.1 hypothetical protein FV218_15810 [Methylobacterium sp. WL69]